MGRGTYSTTAAPLRKQPSHSLWSKEPLSQHYRYLRNKEIATNPTNHWQLQLQVLSLLIKKCLRLINQNNSKAQIPSTNEALCQGISTPAHLGPKQELYRHRPPMNQQQGNKAAAAAKCSPEWRSGRETSLGDKAAAASRPFGDFGDQQPSHWEVRKPIWQFRGSATQSLRSEEAHLAISGISNPVIEK